jgi:putative ABC transport system permease protein
MLYNYLTIAFRSLLRQKSYSFITIVGLALGMACCLVLGLFVRYELSFDRDTPNAEHVYRITATIGRKTENSATTIPNTQFPLALALKAEMPELERVVRVNANGSALLAVGDKKFLERRLLYADDGYFQMFPAEFIAGDPKTALSQPQSVVLTEETAHKFFGADSKHALGKTLRIDNGEYLTVSGVIKNLPHNRHLRFNAMVHMQRLVQTWKNSGVNVEEQWFAFTDQSTYLQFRATTADGTSLAASVLAFKQKLPALVERKLGERLKRVGRSLVLDVQPLTDIHVHPLEGELQPQGSMQTLKIIGAVAVVILVLACINFMNLSTARSTRRAREVGMRKVFGAARWQLVMQFLSESIVVSTLALVLALVLVECALPLVNALFETRLSVGYAANAAQLLVFMGFGLVVGIVAGTYPAVVLSGFAPVRVLKGAFVRSSTGAALRKSLVVVQFSISIMLLVGTIVIVRQLEYTQNKHLGFAKEQLLTLQLPTDSAFGTRRESMKAALKAIPGVVAVAGADYVPGDDGNSQNPVGLQGAPADKSILVKRFYVDEDYLPTVGLSVATGRNFHAAMPTDASEGYLLNESAVKALGLEKPLGTRLRWYGGARTNGTVIGVVKDFHFESLHNAISPAIFIVSKEDLWRFVVRLNTNDVSATMAQIERVWEQFAPHGVFDYAFVDANFAKLYQSEQRIGRIVTVFAGLAVLIACLGLFGLAAFSAEVRTKEIGIRKVLGASMASIIGLLSQDFLKLVLIAIVVATPLSYYLASRWLEEFAYRVELSVWMFVLAAAVAVVVALLTVASQSWRAARFNPVHTLRSE